MERYEIGTKFKSLDYHATGIRKGDVVEVLNYVERDASVGGYTYWGICGRGVDHNWVEKGHVEVVE